MQDEKKSIVDTKAMFKLSYGLFVLSARDVALDKGGDNACIINTVTQLTDNPLRVSMAVNKVNYTHDMIVKTKEFNISVLTQRAPFSLFERFGFHSGKNTDKFAGCGYNERTENGIRYVPEYTNAVISAKVTQTLDCGTHTLFIADVTQAFILSGESSVTYQYYFDYIKPKPQLAGNVKKGFVCKVCGYIYEGDVLPEDFICPLCKHGAKDFEPILTTNNEERKKMANLKGTKTEKNLMEAFAGESQARNKYTYFASRARKDGYEQVAALFEETAGNEKEHAKIWFKLLHGGEVPSTAENLKAAAAGENGEWTDMYKRMANEAREEGFKDIAMLFDMVGGIEKEHEERYLKLLKNVEDGTVFAKKEKSVWICRNCGHIVDSENAPKVCPVCVHPQAYFELRVINY